MPDTPTTIRHDDVLRALGDIGPTYRTRVPLAEWLGREPTGAESAAILRCEVTDCPKCGYGAVRKDAAGRPYRCTRCRWSRAAELRGRSVGVDQMPDRPGGAPWATHWRLNVGDIENEVLKVVRDQLRKAVAEQNGDATVARVEVCAEMLDALIPPDATPEAPA